MKTFIITLLLFNIAAVFSQNIANEDLEKLVVISSSHEESSRMGGVWTRQKFTFNSFYADTIKSICEKNFSGLIKDEKYEDSQLIITYSNLELTYTVFVRIPVSNDSPVELSLNYIQ
jgi:hypothetical protein